MCEQLSTGQSRLERRVELLTKERDSLKQILTLYQEEDPNPAVEGAASQCCFTTCGCVNGVVQAHNHKEVKLKTSLIVFIQCNTTWLGIV